MSLVPDFPPAGSTANESLAQTLAIGNVSGANDILMSAPQKIEFSGDISLSNGVGGDVIVDAIPPNTGPALTEAVYVDIATNKLYYQNIVPTSQDLQQVLLVGNNTGTTDIDIFNGQAVSYDGNIRLVNNNAGGGTGVQIQTIPANTGPTLTSGLVYDPATFNVYTQSLPGAYTAGTGLNLIGNQFNNTGVLSVASGGAGITVGGTPSAPTVSNTGVVSITGANAGTGISIAGTATNPLITNAGVVSITSGNAGTGISISGTATNPTITNAGLLGLTPANNGTGISIGGTATTPIISNSGVVSITSANAGTGITIGGTATVPTITNAGLLGLTSANNGTGISISGTATNPIISATGFPTSQLLSVMNTLTPNNIQPVTAGGGGGGLYSLIIPLNQINLSFGITVTGGNTIILPTSGAIYKISVVAQLTAGALLSSPNGCILYLLYPGFGPYVRTGARFVIEQNNQTTANCDYLLSTTTTNQPVQLVLSTGVANIGIYGYSVPPTVPPTLSIPDIPAVSINVTRVG
jgi:hypothetical protein